MKYVIFGLGSFGGSLAVKLTELGHEVIGVDLRVEKVEAMKEVVTQTVCLNSTDANAVTMLPLREADSVIVAIGEDIGASIMTTALMRQNGVKKLVARAISPLQQTVLEAMQVDEIIHPEEESAERHAKKLNMKGVVDSFSLSEHYNIIEAIVPQRYVGQTIEEVQFRNKYNLIILTIIKTVEQSNIIGIKKKEQKVMGVASADMRLESNDILVIYGEIKDIQRLLMLEY